MASILQFRGRKTIPLEESTLVAGDREAIEQCGTPEALQALIATWANEQANDFKRLDPALRLGAAIRKAVGMQWLRSGRDAKAENEAFEKAVGYKLPHLRSCGRLYDDCLLIHPATDWYHANRERLQNQPRKREGIEYTLSCIKAFKTYTDAKKKNLSDDEAFDAADKTLPKDRAAASEGGPTVTARQIQQRKDSLLIAFMTLMQAGAQGLISDLQQPINAVLKSWENPQMLFSQIETANYLPAEQESYEILAGQLESTDLMARVRASLGLLRFAYDAWASHDAPLPQVTVTYSQPAPEPAPRKAPARKQRATRR